MLQLLNPLWLWGIAGIIVPIVIHLWHIKTGKTLKIGSIALLGESARQSSRSFRVTDWLLLLLRCLVVILLAVLLTAPFWQKSGEKFKAKGWVLLEKAPVKTVYQRFKPNVDSLLKAGYELHQFDASFKLIKPEEILKDSTQDEAGNYWHLLKLLEQKIPAKTPVYLFTGNQLRHFSGLRPNLNFALHWQTFMPADSVSTWIQNAYLTTADSIAILVGKSQPSGTSFSTVKLQPGNRRNHDVQVNFDDGKPVVSLKNDQQKPFPVDTSALRITVFEDGYSADAHYLEAALQAVKRFDNRKMKIISAGNVNQIPKNQNWIFWLSDQNPPKNIAQKLVSEGNLFKYQTGKAQAANSWISENGFSGNANQPINLYLHVLVDKKGTQKTDNQIVWQDGFGAPILSNQLTGNNHIYHFYSRFNPAWNDLAWSSSFPKLMLNLILKSYPQPDFTVKDKRIITPLQLKPIENADTERGYYPAKADEITDLKHACWIALFLVFLVERIISSKTKKQEIYG